MTESINTLDGGYLTGLVSQEFVMHTFSGKVRASPARAQGLGGIPAAGGWQLGSWQLGSAAWGRRCEWG